MNIQNNKKGISEKNADALLKIDFDSFWVYWMLQRIVLLFNNFLRKGQKMNKWPVFSGKRSYRGKSGPNIGICTLWTPMEFLLKIRKRRNGENSHIGNLYSVLGFEYW